MSAAEGDRPPARTQRFRNVVAGVVIGSVIAVLAALIYVLSPNAGGAAGAVCSVAFLGVAFVAWEYLMKPGYGFLHRRRDLESEDEESAEPPTARKVPRSPRPP